MKVTKEYLDFMKHAENIMQGKEQITEAFLGLFHYYSLEGLSVEFRVKFLNSLSDNQLTSFWQKVDNKALLEHPLEQSGESLLFWLTENKQADLIKHNPDNFEMIFAYGTATNNLFKSYLEGLKNKYGTINCEKLTSWFENAPFDKYKDFNEQEMFFDIADNTDDLYLLDKLPEEFKVEKFLEPHKNEAIPLDKKETKYYQDIIKLGNIQSQLKTAHAYENGEIKLKDIDKSLLTSKCFFDKLVDISRKKFLDYFENQTKDYKENEEIGFELQQSLNQELQKIVERLDGYKNEYLKQQQDLEQQTVEKTKQSFAKFGEEL